MANAYYYSSTAGDYTLTTTITAQSGVIQLDGVVGLPGGVPFKMILEPGMPSEEIVRVTAVAGTTLTVVRGWDGSTASAHAGGAKVRHMLTAEDLTLSRSHESSASAHGVIGTVVGTSDIQVLTNKDLTSGSNKFPTSLATDAELAAHAALTATHGATGAVVGTTNTQTLTNKDLTSSSNKFPSSLATDAELSAHTGDTSAHGATGGVVGATKSQTLTNKTLTSTSNKFAGPIEDTGSLGGVGNLAGLVTKVSGWDIVTFQYTRVNGVSQAYFNLTRTGASINAPSNTNITNSQVAQLKPSIYPRIPVAGSTVATGPVVTAYIWPDGTVSIGAISGDINTGDSVTLSFTYINV